MTKPRLTELAKARVDAQTKQELEQLTLCFEDTDEADIVRAALRNFIEQHRKLLPKPSARIIGPRRQRPSSPLVLAH